jgi:integrase
MWGLSMSRKATELGPLSVKRLTTPGMHAVGGATGLYLQVLESGARSWILRIVVGARRRDMGLGGYPDVSLAEARRRAHEKRAIVQDGRDPIEERRTAASALRAAQTSAITFELAAEQYVDAMEPGWRSKKHAQQWRNTLSQYAYPVIGKLQLGHIEMAHVMAVLEPMWLTKTETAKRVRGRIEAILGWATTRGLRTGDNPARWSGHLEYLLPAPSKVAKPVSHPAVAVSDAPHFMQQLRRHSGVGARALEFAILTAARSREVRGAQWSEFDLEGGIWTVPASRMKAGREHKVPLSAAALQILREQNAGPGSDLVFPSPTGRAISDMTMTAVMRRMGVAKVPHGFRSTFKDWAMEKTKFPSEMSEMALAHAIGNKTEAAYRRGDMLERRRKMMADWAKFLSAANID